jgi:hypothetical protein
MARPATFFGATNEGLIDLDFAGQPIAAWPDHDPAQLVKPCPRGLVAAEAYDPLQAEGARTALLRRHPPHRPEPLAERTPGTVKDRARRD